MFSRDWVAKCLGQMTEANKAEAQAELRQVIADRFAANQLWTTDWPAVQLQRFCRVPYEFTFRPFTRLVSQPTAQTAPKLQHQPEAQSVS